MRIDKYLKVTRLIKRRTIAQKACEGGKIHINEKSAKPGTAVKIGDIITISIGQNPIKAEVVQIKESVRAEDAQTMYKIL